MKLYQSGEANTDRVHNAPICYPTAPFDQYLHWSVVLDNGTVMIGNDEWSGYNRGNTYLITTHPVTYSCNHVKQNMTLINVK